MSDVHNQDAQNIWARTYSSVEYFSRSLRSSLRKGVIAKTIIDLIMFRLFGNQAFIAYYTGYGRNDNAVDINRYSLDDPFVTSKFVFGNLLEDETIICLVNGAKDKKITIGPWF